MHWKIKEWASRYLPAEIIGIFMAVVAANIVTFFTTNPIIIAYTGSLSETLFYYSTIIFRDLRYEFRKKKRRTAVIFVFLRVLRNVVTEFGLAEVLDSLFLRPLFMGWWTHLLHNISLGVTLGKLTADITFYIPTIFFYEVRKKVFS